MNKKLITHEYGKSLIRLSRIARHGKLNDFQEMTIDVSLSGSFHDAYLQADNQSIIPTDTIRNTVYALAKSRGIPSIEEFAATIARHFVDGFQQVDTTAVTIEAKQWNRMRFHGNEHPHSFIRGSGERDYCACSATPDGNELSSGLTGLQVLKTTGSGFTGFAKDAYTTLEETEDRILATTIRAVWKCSRSGEDWAAIRAMAREAMLDVFANRHSHSVQDTLFQMAGAVLDVSDAIQRVSLTMPNQHHLLANLQPFGLNNAEVFIPIDEPHGLIQAAVAREDSGV